MHICIQENQLFYNPKFYPTVPAQEMYQNDKRVWTAIFELVVKDFALCQRDGVRAADGELLYPIILGNKGDWSYLVTWPMWYMQLLVY